MQINHTMYSYQERTTVLKRIIIMYVALFSIDASLSKPLTDQKCPADTFEIRVTRRYVQVTVLQCVWNIP